MLIYFYLFIPLLFLPADSSSIRDRNDKNELVPFLSSRLDALKRDPNSLKVVSSDPFIIQLQMPSEKLKEARGSKGSSKKRKRPAKKRISKIKPLRKKHRTRRDLHTTKTKTKKEKLNQSEIPSAGHLIEQKLNNATKNSGGQIEILKALSSYSKKRENKLNKFEGIKNFKDDDRSKTEKVKPNITTSALSRNSLKHHLPPSDLVAPVKLLYPSTPKSDRHPHKYVYKDLVADRERLEQKIKYIKNMLNVNDSAAEDAARIRRRSESDRTANKIAKMFLTLSAVNGLHDRRKSKCDEDDDDEDRTQDIWEKERKNSPSRKSFSSNEERYKVKKWIEFMKNERSSGKICPCTSNDYNEESDIFPLEQKVPRGYFTMERDRSSEESSESYRSPFYHSRHRVNKNNNFPRQTYTAQEDQENKLKASAKNGKKKLELPLDDLEMYRSKAKQILQNAEEILDRIKEEEEKRFSPPNVLMNHLKELTSRIQTDPRNNENDLVRHIQKMLGWSPLGKAQGSANENTFVDNVKSFILDPYEKAKSLTDESTKKLSSYLLRNLGKLPEFSAREKERGEADEKTSKENLKVFFEQVAPKEGDKPLSDSLGKEGPETGSHFKLKDSSNGEDPISITLNNNDEFNGRDSHLNDSQDDSFKQRTQDAVKEQEKEFIEYKEPFYTPDENTTEVKSVDDETVKEKETNEAITTIRQEKEEKEPEKTLEEDKLTSQMKEEIGENSQEKRETLDNFESTRKDQTEKGILKAESTPPALEKTLKDFSSTEKKEGPPQKSKTGHDVTSSENVQGSGEFRKETEKRDDVNSYLSEKSRDRKGLNGEGKESSESNEKEETNKNVAGENLQEKRKFENEGVNEKNKNREKVLENVGIPQKSQGSISGEDKNGPKILSSEDEKSETAFPSYRNQNEELKTLADIDRNLKEIARVVNEIDLDKISSKEGTVRDNQDQLGIKNNKEDQRKTDTNPNVDSAAESFEKIPDSPENTREDLALEKIFEDPTVESQSESPEEKERQHIFNAETTQLEDNSKKLQYVDLIKETDEKSGEFSKSNPAKTENRLQGEHQTITEFEGKTRKHEGEIAQLEHPVDGNDRTGERDTGREEINDENLKETRKIDEKNDEDGETGNQKEEKLKEEPADDEKDQSGEGKTGKHEEENLKSERPDDENGQISEGEAVKEETRIENLKEMRTTNDENDEGSEAGNLKLELPDSENDQTSEGTTGKEQINGENLKEMRTIDGEDDEGDETGKHEEENLKSERPDDENDKTNEGKTEKEEIYDENLKEMRTTDDENDENGETRKHGGENLKQERTDDENDPINDGETGKEEINDETLKTALDSKGDSEPLESINVQSGSSRVPDKQENQNGMNADVTDSFLDEIQKYSNEGLDEKPVNNEYHTKSDEVSGMKATNSESHKSETSTEDVSKRTPLKEALESRSEESLAGEEIDETTLRSEKPTEEIKNQSVGTGDDDEQADTSSKEIGSDDKGTQNSNEDDPTFLKASINSQNGEKSLEAKDADGTASSVALSEKDLNSKSNEQIQNSFEKGDDEAPLKASLNEDNNLSTKDADEATLKETNQVMSETDDGEIQNSYPGNDEILQKEDQNREYLKETDEKDALGSTKPSDDQETNQEYKSLEKTDIKEDTLGKALDKPNQENQKKINESLVEEETFDEHQEEKNSNEDNNENTLMENPKHEGSDKAASPEILLTSTSGQERAILNEENESTLEQTNPDENVQEDGNAENPDDDSKKTLKATLKSGDGEDSEDVNDETLQKADTSHGDVGNPQVEQDDLNFDGGNEYEFLPGTFESGSRESLEEQTHETSKSNEGSEKDEENFNDGETDLGAALKNQDQEETNDDKNTLTEANFKEAEPDRNNLSDNDTEDTLGAVLDNWEQPKGMTDGENSGKFDETEQEKKEENPEEVKDDETFSRATTSETEVDKKTDQHLHEVGEKVSSKAGTNREDQNNLEESDSEAFRTENPEKVPDNNRSDETLSRNLKRLEDELGNKIDNESPLKLAKVADDTNNLEFNGDVSEEGSEETLRAKEINNDLNNQIDHIEEKTSVESARFDEANVKEPGESSDEHSYDNLRAESVSEENSSMEGNDEPPLGAENQFKETNSQELQEQVPPALLSRLVQPPSSAPKTVKSNKLKVPQSIGKIMRDLEGKEKDDVTSVRNLNPEQIDHMLGKIDEAEQQNLIGDEKECEKECACAEEINTRSRNIGRYEIVKDFLHWMKDLQLNRVLSDD